MNELILGLFYGGLAFAPVAAILGSRRTATECADEAIKDEPRKWWLDELSLARARKEIKDRKEQQQ